MVLVCEINMMLQNALLAVKLHLPVKQFLLILSMLLLPLINGVEPQVKVGKMIIHVLVEVGSVET